MPQVVTHISEAYRFDELDDSAKERARDWYREASMNDTSDFDCVIEDFQRVAEIIGIDFDTHEVALYGGNKRREPNIWWSGFCSQGDGACFEGSYDYKATAPAKIREHAPNDAGLHRIADELSAIQLRNAFGLHAEIKKGSSNYSHEHTCSIDIYDRRDEDRTVDEAGAVEELMRDLMRWLYSQLDKVNDYLYSAEHVDESIEANEYMFDEEGNRHDYA